MRSLAIALAILAAGCTPSTRGWTQTLQAGLDFDSERTTAVLLVEIAATAHGELDDKPAASFADGEPARRDEHWPHSHLGIQTTVTTGMTVDRGGPSSVVAVGADFLPFVYDNHSIVGYGGQVQYGAGARDAVSGVFRLWFAAQFDRLAGAPLLGGLMMRCQFAHETGGCGPVLVLTRSRM